MADKTPGGRIAESIEWDQVNRDVDDLIQGAVADLLRGGGTRDAKGRTIVPSFQKVNLNELKGEVKRTQKERDITEGIIDTEKAKGEAATLKKGEAIEAGAQAQATLAQANQAQAEAVAKIHRDVAIALGVDPEAIAEVAQRIKLERPKAEEMLAEIQQMQSVGLLDNPLEWFVNQIQMPSKTEPYNRQADKINTLQNTLDTGLKTAQDAATFTNKGLPTITAAQSLAAADIAIQKGKEERFKAEQELASRNVAFAVQKLSNDINTANLTRDMTQLEIQQNIQSYQASITAINLAETDAMRKIKAVELLEKIEKTKGLDVVLANYDRIMGHPPGTTTRYNYERSGKEHAINITSIGAGTAGASPFDALVNVSLGRPGPNMAPDTRRMFNYLQSHAFTIAGTPEIQRLDGSEKKMVMSKKLQDQVDIDVARAHVMGTPFYELPPATMLGSGKVPANTRLFKALEPLTKQTGPIRTQDVVETIRKEFPNPTEAGQVIAEYYARNITLRNLSMNAQLFGVKLPNMYRVETGFGIFSKPTFDLTKPEEATKYILMEDLVKQSGDTSYTPIN
jgi:hypothetical protein